MPPFKPIAPPTKTSTVADADAFVIPRTLSREQAERLARTEISGGVLRPPDALEAAEIAPPALHYLPFWRIDLTVEGFHVGVSRTGAGGLLPTGGARHKDAVLISAAKRLLLFDPSPKIEIHPGDLVARTKCNLPPAVVILPDVTRADAERTAADTLRRSLAPSSAIYSKFDARTRSADLVYVPLWVVHYRYSGAAKSETGPEECHVALSGKSGKVVSAHHPSALRSVASKVKDWFS